MKIVKAGVEFMTPMTLIDGREIVRHIEKCGRVCYKSENSTTDTSAAVFCRKIIKNKHEAVLEHCSFTIKFTVDRGFSHEIVQHRMASYCQESTRYCNYAGERFGNEITVIEPCYLKKDTQPYAIWENACAIAERMYSDMIHAGCSVQEARAVLPNSLKTEVVMTANIREWRHFLKLRCSSEAHPQTREVARQLLAMCYDKIPVLFDDVIWGCTDERMD